MSSLSQDLSKAPPEVLAQLASIPAIPPPPNTTPNFVDPPTEAPTQLIVTSIVLGLMIVFFLNRAYVKIFLMKKITWDDATLLVATLGSVAYYVACTWGAQRGGIGKHEWDMSVLQATSTDLLVPSWLIAVLTPLTFFFLKPTFFILYLTLFEQLRWARICSWLGLVLTAITYAVLTITVFIFDTPRKGETWFAHTFSPGVKRILQLSVPQSSIGLVIDLYILLIPVLGVSGLNLSPKRKIGVVLIFLSGTMACICSACSIYYRYVLDHSVDTIYALIPVNISTTCEMFVGIICACMPSAAYAARQKNSLYQKLLAALASLGLLQTLLRKGHNSTPHPQATEIHSGPDILKSTDKKYAQYFSVSEFGDVTSSLDYKSVAGKSESATNGSIV